MCVESWIRSSLMLLSLLLLSIVDDLPYGRSAPNHVCQSIQIGQITHSNKSDLSHYSFTMTELTKFQINCFKGKESQRERSQGGKFDDFTLDLFLDVRYTVMQQFQKKYPKREKAPLDCPIFWRLIPTPLIYIPALKSLDGSMRKNGSFICTGVMRLSI